jgi:hypothetical protein
MSAIPSYMLNVQAGDPLRAGMIRDFARLINERAIIPGVGVRLSFIEGVGCMVEAEEQNQEWVHPWLTFLSGDRASVIAGAVNTLMPWLDGRPLDGLDAKGKADPKGAPTLQLKPETFDADGYSWIVIRAKVDLATGKILDPKDGGLTLAQTKVRTWRDGGSIDIEGAGDHPIAQLRRLPEAKEGFGSLSQISFFNMQHRYVKGEGDQPGRHFFFA